MTKFILIGGYPDDAPDGGRAMREELIKGFPEPVKILSCLFARPEGIWEDAFEDCQEQFAQCLPGKQLDMRLADPKKFLEQVRWADALYIRGGETERLAEVLRQNPDWGKEMAGKTIVGSSAGANVIAAYYYGLYGLKVYQGLGLLPIKVIVHYQSDFNAPNVNWEKAYTELAAQHKDLELVTLKEGEFRVFERP